MNTEERVKKLKKLVEVALPLLTDTDSLKFACIPFEEGLDSELFMSRILKTNHKYPHNRCLFIVCYESGSLKLDFKVREMESTLVIKRNGELIYRRTESDLGVSPAEIILLSMILHVKYFITQKKLSSLKTNIA